MRKVNTRLLLFFLFSLISGINSSFSQNVAEERISTFHYYPLDATRLFPTLRPSNEKLFLYTGVQLRANSGSSSKFRDNSFLIQYQFSKKSITHKIGGSFSSRVKGDLYNVTRGYIRYCANIPLNRDMNLSLGVDGGIYSYIFFASAISSGTSFLVFDGNAGIGLELFDAHSIDLSITQFSNTEYNENRIQYIHLPRDINLAYTFLKEINPEVHLKALAWGRLNQDAYYANINGVLTYVNLFGGSWGIDSHKVSTIGFNFFIKDYEEKRLGFYLNYNLPLTDVIVNVSPIELSLALTPKN